MFETNAQHKNVIDRPLTNIVIRLELWYAFVPLYPYRCIGKITHRRVKTFPGFFIKNFKIVCKCMPQTGAPSGPHVTIEHKENTWVRKFHKTPGQSDM